MWAIQGPNITLQYKVGNILCMFKYLLYIFSRSQHNLGFNLIQAYLYSAFQDFSQIKHFKNFLNFYI